MKKQKRLLALILAILLMSALFAGCGSGEKESASTPAVSQSVSSGQNEAAEEPSAAPTEAPEATQEPEPVALQFPLTEDEVEFTMFYAYPPWLLSITDDVADTGVFQQMQKLTGVTINFQAASVITAQEEFSIMLASNEYTDIIYNFAGFSTMSFDEAIGQDIVLPLNDMYDAGLMPNFKALRDGNEDIARDTLTNDGYIPQIYSILSSDYMPNAGLVIRKDWLDKLNLEIPETYEDYTNVLSAFQTELGVANPLHLPSFGSYFGDYISAGYGVASYVADGSSVMPFYVVDGEVKFGPLEDGYRSYLETMHNWYEAGFISPDFASRVDELNYPDNDHILNNELGMWYVDVDTMATYSSLVEDEDFRVVGIPDAVQNKGDVNHLRKWTDANANLVNSGNGLCITTACANPELAAQWLDAHYSEEGSLILNYGGVEGETYVLNDEGRPVYGELVTNNPEGWSFNWAMSYYSAKNYAFVVEYARLRDSQTEDQIASTEAWARSDASYGYPLNASLNEEENEIYNEKYGDVKTGLLESVVKFITGELSIDSFDDFRAQLIAAGAEDMVKVKQSAYDRYMSR